MPYKTDEEKRKKALEYYYKNRDKVLMYQKARWKKKYQNDIQFRQKRQFRDKTRILTKFENIQNKECTLCDSPIDLQRHHFDYSNPLNFVIVCRNCHNQIHHNPEVGKMAINE
jgi:hypothetical protein